MKESIEYSEITPDRFEEAIKLWIKVFGWDGRSYFENYYYHDPWYAPDCSLAVYVNGEMVSAVHICRRPVRVGGGTVWMGGIANVVTLEQYRRRGFSSELLERALRVMEKHNIAFSTLGTGINRHYARHGWFTISTMNPSVSLRPGSLSPSPLRLEEVPWSPFPEVVQKLYGEFQARLPVPFLRNEGYFHGWWYRRAREAGTLYLATENGSPVGYLLAKAEEDKIRILEMASVAPKYDADLLHLVGELCLRLNKSRFEGEVPLLPGWVDILREMGELSATCSYGTMFRPVCMSMDELVPVLAAYQSKLQPWWDPDGF